MGVCVCVCQIVTQEPHWYICLNLIMELGRATGIFVAWFWDSKMIGSIFIGGKAKIVI